MTEWENLSDYDPEIGEDGYDEGEQHLMMCCGCRSAKEARKPDFGAKASE
jgi:hypothetical protein